jgi:hypothetical protein
MERPLKAYSFVGNRWLMKEEKVVVEVEAVAVAHWWIHRHHHRFCL